MQIDLFLLVAVKYVCYSIVIVQIDFSMYLILYFPRFLQVAWIKSDSKAILAIHTHLVAHNTRLSVTHNGHNTWKLSISNVQSNDSGTYMCQINTDPMRSQVSDFMSYSSLSTASNFPVQYSSFVKILSELTPS